MPEEREAIQGDIIAYWNTRGLDYDAGRHGIHAEEQRHGWLAALRQLLPPPPATVLDVGTGTGFLALLMAELGYSVTGIDLAEGMLETARANSASLTRVPRFRVGDAINPDEEAGTFDVVTNRHVLWTLTDPAAALTNWLRLLRPGGRLVIIDYLSSRQEGAARQPHPGYTSAMDAALPLRDLPSATPVEESVRLAGAVNVWSMTLDEVRQIEQHLYSDAGDHLNLRFAVVADRPGLTAWAENRSWEKPSE